MHFFRNFFVVFTCALLLMASSVAFCADESINFSMTDITGKKYRLADYHGKWIIFNYWATWCPSCLDEIPDLIALSEERKADVVVLGVAVDFKSEKEVRDFVDDMLMPYPVILGTSKIRAQFGSPAVLPTTLIFNPQGKLVQTKQGKITKNYIESLISEH